MYNGHALCMCDQHNTTTLTHVKHVPSMAFVHVNVCMCTSCIPYHRPYTVSFHASLVVVASLVEEELTV